MRESHRPFGPGSRPSAHRQQTLDEAEGQNLLTADLILAQLEGEMQAVRMNLVEADDFMDQLAQEPRVAGGRPGELARDAQPARRHFEEALAARPVRVAAVVIDVAAEFPAQHVQVKIVEVLESVVDRVGGLGNAPQRLDRGGTDVAQLHLASQRDQAGL